MKSARIEHAHSIAVGPNGRASGALEPWQGIDDAAPQALSADPFRTRVAALWRSHAPRLLAALVQRFRSLHLAEDCLAIAFTQALAQRAMPVDPAAWLYQCALHAGIDQLRRQQRHSRFVEDQRSEPGLSWDGAEPDTAAMHQDPSDKHRLATLFLCCHPCLSVDSQVMLMLRFCLGLDVEAISRWFYQSVPTVQRRLHRAKDKLEQAAVRFELPPKARWPERLPAVWSALEILYDQSYSDIAGDAATRALGRDAEQLALMLAAQLPHPECLGLAAMIMLAESRRPARIDDRGCMIPLDEQDCTLWDCVRLRAGARLLRRAASARRPGPYQIRAMISAHHMRRADLGATPWPEILHCYDALLALDPRSEVVIEHALATGQVHGAEAGLSLLSGLADERRPALALARAALFERLGDTVAARHLFASALEQVRGSAERAWLTDKIAHLDGQAIR